MTVEIIIAFLFQTTIGREEMRWLACHGRDVQCSGTILIYLFIHLIIFKQIEQTKSTLVHM